MFEAAMRRRYPGEGEARVGIRKAAIAACTEHFDLGLGDENLLKRLCGENSDAYWQALSEVLLARQLLQVGLRPLHPTKGPDFLLDIGGRYVFIEVICPTAVGVPPEWLRFETGVTSKPHEAMLLRWTSAIKEKAEKLLGRAGRAADGYLANGVVRPHDVYVIAVNGRLLRSAFPELEGISTFPFAVEATFSVGPYALTINRETLETTDAGHQHRPHIPKPNGAQVPADTFLDPRFAPISAVWATDVDENGLRDRIVPMAVVHNPLASNALSQGLLPAHAEYLATSDGDVYRLDKLAGRLG